MRTQHQQYLYQQLELLEPSTTKTDSLSVVLNLIRELWNYVYEFWGQKQEPQFCEVRGKDGQIYWKVYDPDTDRSFYLDSLPSVLAWIEERHHSSSQSF